MTRVNNHQHLKSRLQIREMAGRDPQQDRERPRPRPQRVDVHAAAALDDAAMASPVLTGRRSPPPVSSPSLLKLPALTLAVLGAAKPRERLLPAPSALFTSLSPPAAASASASASTAAAASASESASTAASAAASASAGRKKGTRRGTLQPEAKSVLKAWMFSPEHFAHPYPSEEEKEELASEAGIEVKQLSNWFTNARKRLWQPVLRQSGVEVKNFLSTGRGGPRGARLEVPANLQQLVASALLRDEDEDADADTDADERPAKRPRRAVRPAAADAAADGRADERVDGFRESELLAASSLLGLHAGAQHCQRVR